MANNEIGNNENNRYPGTIDQSGENATKCRLSIGEERIGFTAVNPDWTLSLDSTLRLDQSEIEETDAFDDVISRAMRKKSSFRRRATKYAKYAKSNHKN